VYQDSTRLWSYKVRVDVNVAGFDGTQFLRVSGLLTEQATVNNDSGRLRDFLEGAGARHLSQTAVLRENARGTLDVGWRATWVGGLDMTKYNLNSSIVPSDVVLTFLLETTQVVVHAGSCNYSGIKRGKDELVYSCATGSNATSDRPRLHIFFSVFMLILLQCMLALLQWWNILVDVRALDVAVAGETAGASCAESLFTITAPRRKVKFWLNGEHGHIGLRPPRGPSTGSGALSSTSFKSLGRSGLDGLVRDCGLRSIAGQVGSEGQEQLVTCDWSGSEEESSEEEERTVGNRRGKKEHFQ
jgi:hypothetical protein